MEHYSNVIKPPDMVNSFNRYTGVLPYTHTLVTLSTNEYINASYINGPFIGTEQFFIATQGPMRNTRNAF